MQPLDHLEVRRRAESVVGFLGVRRQAADFRRRDHQVVGAHVASETVHLQVIHAGRTSAQADPLVVGDARRAGQVVLVGIVQPHVQVAVGGVLELDLHVVRRVPRITRLEAEEVLIVRSVRIRMDRQVRDRLRSGYHLEVRRRLEAVVGLQSVREDTEKEPRFERFKTDPIA